MDGETCTFAAHNILYNIACCSKKQPQKPSNDKNTTLGGHGMSHITLGALILAGGQNRRMDGSPKALLPNGSGALILDGSAPPLRALTKSCSAPTPRSWPRALALPRCRTRGPAWARWPGWQQRFPPARATALWSPPVICPVLTGPQPSFWPALQTRAGPPGPAGPRGPPPPALRRLHQTVPPGHSGGPRRREHRVGRLFQSVGGQAIFLEGTSLPDAVVCNVNTPKELKELLQS